MSTTTIGIFNFSSNFNVRYEGPLDCRLAVELYTDLSSLNLPYNGMVVSVTADGANNGLYFRNSNGTWTKIRTWADPNNQIIEDDTSVTVVDDDTALGSKMIFNVNGVESMVLDSQALLLKQGQSIGTQQDPISTMVLAENAELSWGNSDIQLQDNAHLDFSFSTFNISGSNLVMENSNGSLYDSSLLISGSSIESYTSDFLLVNSNVEISGSSFSLKDFELTSGDPGTVDLGALGKEFKDLYLTGNIIMGPNSQLLNSYGVPYRTSQLYLHWDVNNDSSINWSDLGNTEGGLIVIDNREKIGGNPTGNLLSMTLDLNAGSSNISVDNSSIYEVYVYDMQSLEFTVQGLEILDFINNNLVSEGETILIGVGQFMKFWFYNSKFCYIIRTL